MKYLIFSILRSCVEGMQCNVSDIWRIVGSGVSNTRLLLLPLLHARYSMTLNKFYFLNPKNRKVVNLLLIDKLFSLPTMIVTTKKIYFYVNNFYNTYEYIMKRYYTAASYRQSPLFPAKVTMNSKTYNQLRNSAVRRDSLTVLELNEIFRKL